jgi:hypothetical protein
MKWVEKAFIPGTLIHFRRGRQVDKYRPLMGGMGSPACQVEKAIIEVIANESSGVGAAPDRQGRSGECFRIQLGRQRAQDRAGAPPKDGGFFGLEAGIVRDPEIILIPCHGFEGEFVPAGDSAGDDPLRVEASNGAAQLLPCGRPAHWQQQTVDPDSVGKGSAMKPADERGRRIEDIPSERLETRKQ